MARHSAAAVNADHLASTRLRGPWLAAARGAWVGLLVLVLVLFVVALRESFQATLMPEAPETRVPQQRAARDVQLLLHWGISLNVFAVYHAAQLALFGLTFMVAGAILFWHKSDNPMALFVSVWFVTLGLTATPALDPLLRAYPTWELPGRFVQGASVGCFPILTYLFPDGRFVPRWTRFLTIAWIGWIVISPFTPFSAGDFTGASPLWFGVLVPGGMGIGFLAQIYRYLRISNRVERQQTKWVLIGLIIVAIGIFLYSFVPVAIPTVMEPGFARVLYLFFAETFLLVIPFCLLPVLIGIAILRYRLWDIDIIIRRTLVYSLLSATLALIYFGSVVELQGLLGPLVGERNQLTVVASTLAIAALFQPLRRRIQALIDRRFYRHKYDAAQTLHTFGTACRDEVNLNRLCEDLLEVVDETMEPSSVSLWLRKGTSHDGRKLGLRCPFRVLP